MVVVGGGRQLASQMFNPASVPPGWAVTHHFLHSAAREFCHFPGENLCLQLHSWSIILGVVGFRCPGRSGFIKKNKLVQSAVARYWPYFIS